MRDRQTSSASRTVLCVDDDEYLTNLLTYALTREGYMVKVADSAAAALLSMEGGMVDAAIIDVGLPDMNGFALCAKVRAAYTIPIIMLTAASGVQDMVQGFTRGADDFVVKPFTMQVLVLRLAAALRRANRSSDHVEEKPYRARRIGPGWFDPVHNQLTSERGSTRLTRIEAKILHLLLANEQQVYSADQIIERVWGYETDTDASVVKTHIRHLRAKLTLAFGPCELIYTIPGRGYTLRTLRLLGAADSATTKVEDAS
jgi:DNA-binding response OmpR family regulator